MVNTEMLNERIKNSGKKINYLADKVGCSRQYFRAKCINKVSFNLDEVEILCEELNIKKFSDKNQIFFAKRVTKKQ